MATSWKDDGHRYGIISRAFHWSMAFVICWQFSGMVIAALFGRSGLTDLLNSTHGELGVVILILAPLRALWGFYNLNERPPQQKGFLGLVAHAGHGILYLLMLVIPAIALIRAAGSEWGLALFGYQIVPRGGENIGWMVAPANLLHGTLAWTLLVLVGGHVAMVVVHRLAWKDNVLSRMAGRSRKIQATE